MAIDYAGSNTWFGASVHIKASVWSAFSVSDRTAAVAHAARFIAQAVGDTLDSSVTTDDDFPRHDAAVYEQALWMLEQSHLIADGSQSAPKFLGAISDTSAKTETRGYSLAPEAARHLARNPKAVRLCRG